MTLFCLLIMWIVVLGNLAMELHSENKLLAVAFGIGALGGVAGLILMTIKEWVHYFG